MCKLIYSIIIYKRYKSNKTLYTPNNRKWSKLIMVTDTLDTVIDSLLIEINEEIINDLSRMGYSRLEATKVVSEFSDFDLVKDAELNPVSAF